MMGRDPPNAAGAIVMAVGIFVAASLPRLGGGGLAFPAAVVVTLMWLAVAGPLAASAARPGGLARRIGAPIEFFGIGTWVGGTAVLARVLMLAAPDDPWPARAAFALAAVLWLWFMPQAVGHLVRLARSRLRPNGIILLSTVATQAIPLMALRLLPPVPAAWIGAVLMALGASCYTVAAFLVVRGHAGGGWRLATDWANGNCILHGALSISGLAAVVGRWFDASTVLVYWLVVIAVLVSVELIESARLVARVRSVGWREAVFVYDVSQWARNFTFGMFYAFTLAFAQAYPVVAPPAFAALRAAIVAGGPYVVLFLLLAEAALMLTGLRSRSAEAPASS
jgi:hypothetical protein